jgi:hypothetical protein
LVLNPTVQIPANPLGRLVVVAVVVAAFGPYVAVTSVRTEQAAIYGLLLLILPFTLLSMRPPIQGLRLIISWVAYLLAALIAVVIPPLQRTSWLPGSPISGLDNLLLPLALMVLIFAAVKRAAAPGLLLFAGKLIALAVALNGVLAVVMTRVDLSALLRPFVAPAGATSTVAERAAELGRVAGVFGQPAEAGLAYGLAGLAACYVWRERPLRMCLVLVPIILGGLLCVSKIFILGGLPLILWAVLRGRRSGDASLVLVAGAAALGVTQSGLLNNWIGAQYLNRLLQGTGSDPLYFFTAGRLGEQSTLSGVIDQVQLVNPWFGVGIEGLSVPYDNGWVEAFVIAGIVGVACYSMTLVVMFAMARTDADAARRAFMTAVAVLAVGGSIGIPALTANRVGSLLWLLTALVAMAHKSRPSTDIALPAVQPPGLGGARIPDHEADPYSRSVRSPDSAPTPATTSAGQPN